MRRLKQWDTAFSFHLTHLKQNYTPHTAAGIRKGYFEKQQKDAAEVTHILSPKKKGEGLVK